MLLRSRNIIFFASALVLVLFLAGCSSGGNGSAPVFRAPQAAVPGGAAQPQSVLDVDNEEDHRLVVTSETFKNNERVPQSMVYNSGPGTPCTGGDKSPQLTWHGAPGGTRTFTVLMFDVTAAFTHWGMYNIPATTTSLPENAGAAGSTAGSQILNDFFDQYYDGPCPPSGLVHHYIITVYALDNNLNLPSPFGQYPPFAETLLFGLLGDRAHILAAGRITGLYST